MATIISSQRYIDDDVVASKLAFQDFAVTLSPVFTVDGIDYQTVMDGHHSLAAAHAAGAEPEYTIADRQMADTVALLERGNVEDFLVATRMDSDYFVVATGEDVW